MADENRPAAADLCHLSLTMREAVSLSFRPPAPAGYSGTLLCSSFVYGNLYGGM
jgi:hypothetical protein